MKFSVYVFILAADHPLLLVADSFLDKTQHNLIHVVGGITQDRSLGEKVWAVGGWDALLPRTTYIGGGSIYNTK